MTLASWDVSHYDRMPVHTKLPIISKPRPPLLSSLLKQEPGLWPWPWRGVSCTVYTSNWFTPRGIWKFPYEASSVKKIMYILVLDFCLQLAKKGKAMVRTHYRSDQTDHPNETQICEAEVWNNEREVILWNAIRSLKCDNKTTSLTQQIGTLFFAGHQRAAVFDHHCFLSVCHF